MTLQMPWLRASCERMAKGLGLPFQLCASASAMPTDKAPGAYYGGLTRSALLVLPSLLPQNLSMGNTTVQA